MTLLRITLRAWFPALIWLALALPASKADYYVAQNGQTPAGPYTSWMTAASNIQDAVNAAANNSTVWVGSGRYTVPTNAVFYTVTNVVYINKPISLRSSNGVPEDTVIDGEGRYRGLAWNYGSASTSLFLLDGFAISNCLATNVGGGIIFVPNVWTALVQNCVIRNNIASSRDTTGYSSGGGLYAFSYSGFGITISNCLIGNNISTNVTTGQVSYAGGIYLYSNGKKIITDCTIENNRSGFYGGGMYLLAQDMLVENCIIRGNRNELANHGNYSGGAMYLSAGIVTLRNCLLYDNYSGNSAGAINKYAPSPANTGLLAIINCTIVSNVPLNSAVYFRRWDRLHLCNSIVYSNDIAIANTYPFFFTNSWIASRGVTNGVNGEGNITNGINPRFVDVEGKDFRLAPGSPCINAGANHPWTSGAVDIDGRERIRYGTVDMGAHEHVYEGTLYLLR